MMSTRVSNLMFFLIKLVIAGIFAYTTGSVLDMHAVSFVIAAFVGLMGVKSFEFALSTIAGP